MGSGYNVLFKKNGAVQLPATVDGHYTGQHPVQTSQAVSGAEQQKGVTKKLVCMGSSQSLIASSFCVPGFFVIYKTFCVGDL